MKRGRFRARWEYGPPPWVRHGPGRGPWPRGREFLFLRFARIFGVLVLLVLGGMAVLAFLLSRLFGGNGQTALGVWVGGMALLVFIPWLAVRMGRQAFRDIATPLADVMQAADRVAEGDLGVRVAERGPGEFNRLAVAFNNMVGELQRADRQRRNLAADVAHELRTPLQIIQGNLEGVLDGVYEPDEDHLRATLEETHLLARLVEDLRVLSLAEAGQLPLADEPVSVAELLADTATSFSGQAEAAGVALRVEVGDGVRAAGLRGDADRLNQVLGNLVANALRYTPRGGAIVLAAQPAPGGVRITVQDDGQGMDAADLPYIFDRFWRADRARTHADGAGSGLGLAIARQLVAAHHGQISVQSTPGQGTTFTIDLPAAGVVHTEEARNA